MEVDQAGREDVAVERNALGVGRRVLAAPDPIGDPTVFDEQEARLGLAGPGVQQQCVVEEESPGHVAAILSSRGGGHRLKARSAAADGAGVAESSGTTAIAEDLQLLDVRLKQLKLEYDQYFLGARPREPVLLRSDVQKLVVKYSNLGIQNTALRFKFNTLCSRYFAMRRQWDATLRQIEEGTYARHVFKTRLHESERPAEAPASNPSDPEPADLFDAYVAARRSCNEEIRGITRERLDQLVAGQRSVLQKRYGCQEVRFRVVVEDGKAKLRATPVRPEEPVRST
jgi:hypothetical protein